ncbi:MAG: RsmB/NOP family class I SAM-dependent RNA methyltransferase, partial [Clostridia bacterium]|nr:RsmB/NOP family class I SAM-dependent RNA methyltransferase [Clostridia bacterium]
MNLPESFKERMKIDLKNEYEDFIKSYENPPYIGLRVNTLKLSSSEFQNTVDFCGERVEWCPTGFYYDGKKGNHGSAIAGLFYSQDPSAMIAAELADVKKGDKVLDLCAAPGGKSTQLAAKLCGSGLLLANEVNGSRAKILCENIERMGIKNAVVTNMYPEKMEKLFPEFFDKIVVDAPCSGEGMFRKDPVAIAEWS